MLNTPRELLDTSIAQLQILRAFLNEQLGVRADESERQITPDVIACQEIVVSLAALIAKAQVADAIPRPSPGQLPLVLRERSTGLPAGVPVASGDAFLARRTFMQAGREWPRVA